MKILIAEDKAIIAADLVDRLNHFGYPDILGPFADGKKALQSALKEQPDLAILDVTLKGDFSGVHLAKEIITKGLKTNIVFLTQHQDEDVLNEALSVEPLAFINKPYTNSELKAAIHKAKLLMGDEHTSPKIKGDKSKLINDRIFVRNGKGKSSILISDILWIESGGGGTSSLITEKDLKSNKGYYPTISTHLKSIEPLLLEKHFVRSSRYHLVNLAQVERILDKQNGKRYLIICGQEIPVGEKYRKVISESLLIW
uniref:LytR/AlgR family response regulator transcription factor n=2 Tax=Roseivirga sp. TaxID=1964215 RepID=UPI004047E351